MSISPRALQPPAAQRRRNLLHRLAPFGGEPAHRLGSGRRPSLLSLSLDPIPCLAERPRIFHSRAEPLPHLRNDDWPG